jgi:thiol-disulfide isomerase/thioredoxin
MGKITPPPQLDHILATVRYGNLSAALANPAQAGAAVEFTTVLFHLRNKVDQSRLVRALKAEEGPQVGGFVCHRLPIVDYAGAKLHSFLFFPEADECTVLVALALKDDAFPLVSSGGGMNPTMQAILTALEPGHFWMALSLESFKPLLTMATMAAGSNLPPEFAGELKPILTELPKARGLFFHTRLVDNVVRASVALSFETQGPGGTISTSLSSLWNSKLKQTVQAAGANSKIAADIARTLRVAVRGTAVNVNIQLTTAALAADYPMMAASLRNLPAMSVPMTAAGTPGAMGPSGAEVPPSPGKTPPPNTTEPMTPSDGSPSSPRTMLGRSRSNPNAPYGLEVNLRAPDIEGTDAEGKRFKLSDYKGKIIVLDFWGYWCPPCRSMLPHERELVERLQNEPFVFLGVNTDLRVNFNREKTKDPVTWRNFMDGQRGPICQKYKIEAYPTLFLIDANMVIRHKFVGVPPNNVLDKAIDDLIAELKGR